MFRGYAGKSGFKNMTVFQYLKTHDLFIKSSNTTT
jgi:hypothetical protein